MRVVVNNWIRIYQAKEETLDEIRDILTYKNPDYHRAKALIAKGMIGRTELPPKRIRCYKEFEDHLAIPRGTGRLAREIGVKHNEKLLFLDQRSVGYPIDFVLPFRGDFKKFEDYQLRCISSMEEFGNGSYICPTGGGKTLTAAGFVNLIKVSTIMIIDRKAMILQWKDELEEKTLGKYEIGIFSGKEKNFKDFTLATIQSLKNLSEEKQKQIRDKFGIVIVDEVHKASAPIFTIGVPMFSAKYIIGLSASKKRKDRKDFIYRNYVGPIREEASDKEVEATGRIVSCKYQFINTGLVIDYDEIDRDITRVPLEMLSDYDRNMRIISEVEKDIKNGWVPIVFSNRVPHIKFLTKEFRKRHYKTGIIYGKIPDEEREDYKRKMKDGDLEVLVVNVTTSGYGMDIPRASSAHITFYTTNEVYLRQIPGRIRRKFPDKEYGRVVYYKDKIIEHIESKKRPGVVHEREVNSYVEGYEKVRKFFEKKLGFSEQVQLKFKLKLGGDCIRT